MKCVIHRQESYPDNVGHWQCSVALEVLLTRVSARLRKEPTNIFGQSEPHSRQYQSRPASETGIGSGLNGRKPCFEASRSMALVPDSRINQVPRDVQGSSRPLLGMKKSESKRMRMSVNMGTREARLSRVVAQLRRSMDRRKHLPMRQPSGGAPVVVGDRESRSHGEGVQDDS
jgi:hypothetical protein